MTFLSWLENSAFSIWFRGETGFAWAYPIVLFLHTVGLSLLVGANMAIALRLLGAAPRLPIAPLEKLYRVMWIGFWINAASGVMLLVADATTKLTNPVFLIKMGFIAAAVINMVWLRRRVFRGPRLEGYPIPTSARTFATLAFVFWIGAISAGRLMAYLGPVSGAPGLENSLP